MAVPAICASAVACFIRPPAANDDDSDDRGKDSHDGSPGDAPTADAPPDVTGIDADPDAGASGADAIGDAAAPVACQRQFVAAGRQWANAVAVGADGRIAIAGQYDGSPDFGGGPLPAVDANGAHGFVAVFDHACKHVFSRAFAEAGLAVAFTPTGDLVWSGTPTYNPHYVLLEVLDHAGAIVRTTNVPGTGGALATSIAVDASGNLFLAGDFYGDLDFGGGALSGPSTGTDLFLAKLDASGRHVWSKAFGGPENVPPAPLQQDIHASGLGITSGGDVVLYAGTIDFGGGDLGAPTYPHYKTFLAALKGADGSHAWSKAWQDVRPGYPTGLAVSPDGVFLGGNTSSTLDFGTGPISPPAGGTNMVLASFHEDGGIAWALGVDTATPSGLAARFGDLKTVTGGSFSSYAAATGAAVGSTPLATNTSWQSIAIGPARQVVVGGQAGAYPNEDVFLFQQP